MLVLLFIRIETVCDVLTGMFETCKEIQTGKPGPSPTFPRSDIPWDASRYFNFIFDEVEVLISVTGGELDMDVPPPDKYSKDLLDVDDAVDDHCKLTGSSRLGPMANRKNFVNICGILERADMFTA